MVNVCIMSVHVIGPLYLSINKQECFSQPFAPDALWVKRSAGVMNLTVSASDKNRSFTLDLLLY